MAEFLERYKSASIQIQGYASKIGTPEYNLELSKKRAHAVEDELLSYGTEPSRVTIVGYGETRLESEGEDETSHALNRRVTATVVGLKEEVIEEWTIFTVIEK
jgi:outer membrane protein OmpA-like peptidoglycan-associated protein